MPRLLQINPVLRQSTSTGRIMREIGEIAISAGWESFIAYSRGRDGKMKSSSEIVPVGNKFDVCVHGLMTRLLDRHGLASRGATHRFIEDLKRIQPDIVHIHNIHGYFLNYPVLFDFLSKSNIKVVWTVHDCWLYTGHCYYYDFVGCDKWRNRCGDCPQRLRFPRSLIIDRSAENYKDKCHSFTSIPEGNMVIVPVSNWIRSEMASSFLKGCRFQVIHNGIDTDIFRPEPDSNVRQKYGLEKYKRIILGLASIWSREKGLDDFVEMSRMTSTDERIVLVGVDDKIRRHLPSNITAIRRTDNVHELAQLYSIATAFVNPTWQDNYPTVNLEAVSCGTPVVTYRTGGSPESLTEITGRVIEQGDVRGLLDSVRELYEVDRTYLRDECRRVALANFRKQDRYAEYLNLYNSLLKD